MDEKLKQYKCIFFDLDRTLWNYRVNSEQTLIDLLNKFTPQLYFQSKKFIEVFYDINEKLWLDYRDGKITKNRLSSTRFVEVYKHFNIDASSFSKDVAKYYIDESPRKTTLYPDTMEVLSYLKDKGYTLFLLTNGFLEVQKVKIKASNIEQYFEKMITSEEVGFQKPDKRIFEYAINAAGALKEHCIMIGDDLDNDISGAQNFGIDSVYFNNHGLVHQSKPTYEINELIELVDLF